MPVRRRTLLELGAGLLAGALPGCRGERREQDARTSERRAERRTTMSDPKRFDLAVQLMTEFAERTGLASDQPPRRYLWTDAFAVCTFLGLAEADARGEHRDLALRLVDQVHHVLGRHRPDDPRTGWISGLSSAEGEAHPTRGGLRIGKPLPERGPDEPFDPELEWERDGQYYHYLTKWMHALDRLARATGEATGNRWARELAQSAHAAFTYAAYSGASRRMYWKMSVDLRRPLVSSMGQHDPLDGLVTYLQLRANSSDADEEPTLGPEIADLARIAKGRDWRTDDPLGLGGLLTDAHRLARLARRSAGGGELLAPVLAAARAGVDDYLHTRPLERPARERLAFRELGLSIGLHALERMWTEHRRSPLETLPRAVRELERLVEHLPLRAIIESFWSEPEHRRVDTWLGHRDINDVMLASSLAPEGYLSAD